MEEIKNILSKYDDPSKKGLEYFIVSGELGKVSDVEKETKQFRFEITALSFYEKINKSAGECYFGPELKFKDAKGNTVEIPNIKDITPECIKYWQHRYLETKNPMMKARYAGLLFEFQEGVTSKKKDRLLINDYIDNLLLAVEEDYPKYPNTNIFFLTRSFELLHLSKGTDFVRLKKALKNFDETAEQNDSPGLCVHCFALFLNNKDVFTQDEQKEWVEKQHIHLTRLCGRSQKINAIDEQVEILIQFYEKGNDKNSILSVLNQMYDYLQKEKESMNAMAFVHWLEILQKRYSTAKLKEEAQSLLCEIRDNSPRILSEMGSFTVSEEVPMEYFTKLETDLIGEGDPQKMLERFALLSIPNKKREEEQLRNLARMNPLLYDIPTKLYGYKGMQVATLDSIDNDFDGHLALHYENVFKINAPLLHWAKTLLTEKAGISIDDITTYLFNTPCIESNRHSIIRRGIESYLQDDYLVAIHLLIPQIEQAVRNLLEINGGVVLKCENNAYRLRTFNDILGDSIIEDSLGENICYYYLQLLTNNKGLNLRNEVCHGIAAPEMFNQATADMVFHALLILGLVKPIKTQQAPS